MRKEVNRRVGRYQVTAVVVDTDVHKLEIHQIDVIPRKYCLSMTNEELVELAQTLNAWCAKAKGKRFNNDAG